MKEEDTKDQKFPFPNLIPESPFPYSSDERPDFGPTQIRSVEEIITGQILIAHTRNRINGTWDKHSVKVIRVYPHGDILLAFESSMPYGHIGFSSLSAYSVIPEWNGKWNTINWFEDPTKVATTE